MLRGSLTVLAGFIVFVAVGETVAQDRRAGKLSESPSARLVEPTNIQELQLATLGKYSGKLVESPVANKTKPKRRSYQDETLRDEMSNSFIVGGGYNYQRVDDMPVTRVQGAFVTGFYYPVSWVGFGGEYQYGRGTENSTVGGVARQDRLTRHVVVLGPEFSAYPGDGVRLFFHPLAGWARERMTTRIGNLTGTSEDTNLAVNLGGGMDVRLSRSFSWRAFQFDYLGIRRNSSWQNNWRLATGIAVRPR